MTRLSRLFGQASLMRDHPDILISVLGRFADGMIDGTKRVELRRRAPKVPPKTRMWIYEKAPTASVRALAILGQVHELPPNEIWDRYGSKIGLTAVEFDEYVNGARTVSALVLDHVHHLRTAIGLETLRGISGRFHPPQFYLKLPKSGLISQTLSREITCSCVACVM